MLSSSSTPHQPLPPPPWEAFLYLLVSRQEPGLFKVGVTRQPAMRFNTLTKRFGEFDLKASTLVLAKNLRAAHDLEAILRSVFIAPAWRAKPPIKSGRGKTSDGDTEWYDVRAFEAMVNFVTALTEHDHVCDLHRFSILQNIQDCDPWREHLRDLGVQTRFRTPSDVAREAQKALLQNEARFACVQAWMNQRRHQLVSNTPFASDSEGNRGRTFVYRDDNSHEANEGGWENLAASCIISHVNERGSMNLTYLGTVTEAADGLTNRVEFLLTPSFTKAATDFPALSDLLTRIEDWLDTPSA